MARLGIAFVISGFIEVLGELLVRSLLKGELGADAVGQFQAAWMVSMTYAGLVLSAMSADYYPRLASAMLDHASANRLVNEQTEVALLLAAPMLLAILGLAPWVVALLYSRDFNDAVTILRWHVLGDVLKVASWPLGYFIMAAGDGRGYLLSVSAMSGLFVVCTWLGLPLIGIQASGVGFLAMYAGYLPVAFWLVHRRTGFLWDRRVGWLLVGLITTSTLVFLCAVWSKWFGAALGCGMALIFGIYGLVRLGRLIALGHGGGKLFAMVNWMRVKIGIRH